MFEVELPTVVLAIDIISDLSLNAMLCVHFELIVNKVEDEMHDPIPHPSV